MAPLAGIALAVVSALCLTAQSLAVRVGTRENSVTTVVAVMFGVNVLLVGPVAALAEFPGYGVTPRSLAAFAAAGLLGSLLGRLCYFAGIERIGSSRTEPLKALFPVVSVGAAVLVLGESVTPRLVFGTVLVLAGSVAVVLEARNAPVTGTGRQFWVGLSFPLAAAALIGIDPILTKVGLATGTPPLVGVAIRVAAGGAGIALYLGWRALREGPSASITVDRWVLAASLANTGYLLAYYAALARAPVAVVAPVLGSSTLMVVLGAALFLPEDERVTAKLVGAALLVLAGVAFVVQG